MDDRKHGSLLRRWRRLKESSQFHNVLMFLVFVAIALIFWFIVALNDSVTETFRVKLNIQNVPDSVTFINDPPQVIHVTLRDKGTNILRSGIVKSPEVNLNFRDFARDGIFRVTSAELTGEMKEDIGAGIQIANSSLDSLRLYYTTDPGRRVPVVVQADLTAASGYMIASQPMPLTKSVLVYSRRDEADTIHKVLTQKLTKRDLSKSSIFKVKLRPIPNVKIVPNVVKVRVPVEALVHKVTYVPIEIYNVPEGESLLLFPNRVPVSCFVPMSRFNDEKIPVRVSVDYSDTKITTGAKIPVRITNSSPSIINAELQLDSVEYTLVR